MEKVRNIVVIGAADTGKTTLANALMEKDNAFHQGFWDVYIPTETVESQMLRPGLQLTDTPGYSPLFQWIPQETVEAVAFADTLVVLLSEELADEVEDIPSLDPDWESRRNGEAELLKTLLDGKTRDIYFVLPYYTGDWPEGEVPCSQGLRLARKRFAHFSCHGEDGFFCIDPMEALMGALELDQEKLESSGILPLKEKLMG